MSIHKRISGTSSTMAVGVVLGVGISFSMIFVLSLTLAWLLHSDKIPMSTLGYGSMGIVFASALVGALIAVRSVKRRKLVVAALSGGGLLLVLFCVNALFLGGNFQGGFATVGLIVLGSAMPALIGGSRIEKRGQRRGGI